MVISSMCNNHNAAVEEIITIMVLAWGLDNSLIDNHSQTCYKRREVHVVVNIVVLVILSMPALLATIQSIKIIIITIIDNRLTK